MREYENYDRRPKLYDIFRGEVANVQSYGAFIKIPNCRRQGLVHKSQMSSARVDDPNEMLARGETVYCKVIGIENEGDKISLSMKVVNQTTGADQDPTNLQSSQDERKRRQWNFKGRNKIELGAELNTTCGRCGGHGHLTMDCYAGKGRHSYDLLPNMDEMFERAAADRDKRDSKSHKKKKKSKSKKEKKKAKKRRHKSSSDDDDESEDDKKKKKSKKRKDSSDDSDDESDDNRSRKKIRKRKQSSSSDDDKSEDEKKRMKSMKRKHRSSSSDDESDDEKDKKKARKRRHSSSSSNHEIERKERSKKIDKFGRDPQGEYRASNSDTERSSSEGRDGKSWKDTTKTGYKHREQEQGPSRLLKKDNELRFKKRRGSSLEQEQERKYSGARFINDSSDSFKGGRTALSSDHRDRSPKIADKSTRNRGPSPGNRDKYPRQREESPRFNRDGSPKNRDKSQRQREGSPPRYRDRSPGNRNRSPRHRNRSPGNGDRSPRQESPRNRDRRPRH